MDIRDLFQRPPGQEGPSQARTTRRERRSFSGVEDVEGTTLSETTVVTPQGSTTTVRTASVTDPSGRTVDLTEAEGHRCAVGGEFLASVDPNHDVCVRCFAQVCALHRIETPHGVYCFTCVYRRWVTLAAILVIGGLILCLVL